MDRMSREEMADRSNVGQALGRPANQDQFDKVMGETFETCQKILSKKGPDYAGNSDRYNNFRLVAELIGISPYQVLAVYACKQFLGELNAIKQNPMYPTTAGEPFSERVHDTINYQLLLKGMREEDEHGPNNM